MTYYMHGMQLPALINNIMTKKMLLLFKFRYSPPTLTSSQRGCEPIVRGPVPVHFRGLWIFILSRFDK